MDGGSRGGAVYSCQENGWKSNEEFVTCLRLFVYLVKPTNEEIVVLILDSHVTYTKNLAAGLVMVSLPPHTIYRLKPLNVAFYEPFGK